MPYTWPPSLCPSRVMFHPDVPSRSGGMSLSGVEQVVVSPGGRWRARLSFQIDSERTLPWRAILARVQGRAGTILVGPFDVNLSPGVLAGRVSPGDVPHSDDAFFSDGSGYFQGLTTARLNTAVLRGAQTLRVHMIDNDTPQAGQYFGLGNRLHLIGGVEPLGAFVFELTFWPPARQNYVNNALVDFDDPVCEMRFADDATGELDHQKHIGSPTLELVEA